MALSSLTPDFRESLRQMADEIAQKKAAVDEAARKEACAKANEEKLSAEASKPVVRVASELEQIEEVTDEGNDVGADNK